MQPIFVQTNADDSDFDSGSNSMTQLNRRLLFGDFDLDYLFYISPNLTDHSKSKRTHVVKLSQLRQKARAAESPATPINTPSNGENSLS